MDLATWLIYLKKKKKKPMHKCLNTHMRDHCQHSWHTLREDERSGLATMYHNLRNSVNGVRFVAFINKKHVFQCHEQTF